MSVDPEAVYCQFCSAAALTPCTDLFGNVVPPHRTRLRLAEGADGAAPDGTPWFRQAW